MKKNSEYIRRHWENGKHAGFLTCDIVWFFIRAYTGWAKLVSSKYGYPIWLWFVKDHPEEHQYIRCPICIVRRRFVNMHICTEECEEVFTQCIL